MKYLRLKQIKQQKHRNNYFILLNMMENRRKILICIVIYNEVINNAPAYISLSGQNTDNCELFFYFFDNSPKPQEVFIHDNYYYEHDSSNPGIAYAYNMAYNYAKNNNYDWMLLSDQDTLYDKSLLKKYWCDVEKNKDIELFTSNFILADNTLFAPVRYCCHFSRVLKRPINGIYSLHRIMPINSGTLITVDLFGRVGGYNDKLRIDFCDCDFFLRVRKISAAICVVDCVSLQDFSNNLSDIKKMERRFEIFIRDARIFMEGLPWMDKIFVYTIVLKHMFALCLRMKSVRFIKLIF